MKKWMMFVRESDNIIFIWNGEGCVRASPIYGWVTTETIPVWHHNYGELPEDERNLLDDIMNSRARGFTILHRGRYRILQRGTFPE